MRRLAMDNAARAQQVNRRGGCVRCPETFYDRRVW